MANQRLLAALTALLLVAGTPSAQAAYTLTNLLELERFVLAEDWEALMRYIERNPALLEGADPLAVELRTFLESIEGDFLGALGANFDAPSVELVQALQDSY
ncbi:hypothetical protein [Rhodophyticola porphyridii]|uniref:hypothetical protein n=1 Tax=Rhodophyticola porphyridii TaxID=1852017 RepID=UPI0011C47B7D|nr:hypothetical protein [Rhodophyticola porphyridii]